jgi:starvation-inducible DNA-binding protein
MNPTASTTRVARIATTSDLGNEATHQLAAAANAVLADVFALYLKTKNFHWHISGPHFRDWHELLDVHAGELFEMTDAIAERVRKLGRPTLHSIGEIARLQRILDNDAEAVEPHAMLAELAEDHRTMTARMRELHALCDEHRDVATASLLETWIDASEKRAWFLFETTRSASRV